MSIFSTFSRFFSWAGGLSDQRGLQTTRPFFISSGRRVATDEAMQVSTVFACVNLLAKTIASMPLNVYELSSGSRVPAEGTFLWQILHYSPNQSMTAYEFWSAMICQLALRGNAYARIVRDRKGEVETLWPLNAEQMQVAVQSTGDLVYKYSRGDKFEEIPAKEILHIKGLGNGCVGLSTLSYMSGTTAEAVDAQRFANQLSEHGGSPQGALTIDHILSKEERALAKQSMLGSVRDGQRLILLEADMKFVPMSLTPAETQLLETREFSVKEICRWFGVPTVLVDSSTSTTWGSGISEITSGFEKFTIGPMLTNIQQAITRCVLSPAQRSKYVVEFSTDALMRTSAQDRYSVYSTAVQNGLMTRNEVRALENRPAVPGGDKLTAQTNLAPLELLGQVVSTEAPQEEINDIKQ